MKRPKRSKIWLLEEDKFRKLISENNSIGPILAFFEMQNKGSNYQTLMRRINELNINIDHIRNSKNKRRSYTNTVKTEDILVENSNFARHALKKRIIKNDLIKYECSKCKLTNSWNNEKLSLVLDHINGVSNDNRLENLRFLCPNCNSQTDTFSGRNKKY